MARTLEHKGLTLVEVTATLAIVGMLTATSLAVVASLARIGRVDDRRRADETLRSSLKALLWPELQHMTEYRSTPNGFAVRTLSAVEPDTLARKHLPAEVTYDVIGAGDRQWLIRRQTVEAGPTVTHLVACGVTSVHVRDAAAEDEELDYGEWLDPPAAIRVTLDFADPSAQPINYTLPLGMDP